MSIKLLTAACTIMWVFMAFAALNEACDSVCIWRQLGYPFPVPSLPMQCLTVAVLILAGILISMGLFFGESK